MKTKFQLTGIVFLLIMFIACEKGPGEGGTSTIRGKIVVYNYNHDFTNLKEIIPGAKEDVYLIYGDDVVYGDKFEASYDGTYEFNYLREGSYKVFAYSKDSTLDYDQTAVEIAIIKEIEITAKDQLVEVPEIRIIK